MANQYKNIITTYQGYCQSSDIELREKAGYKGIQ